MNNEDVAATLNEIAELLELKKDSTFRIRAYQNAARTLGGLSEDVRQIIAAGELEHVRGIGEGIAKKIVELTDTGHIEYLDELREEFPPGVRALLSVPGVGPSLARRVYRELGVQSPDELRAAAEDGRLASMSGFGQKSAESVLRGLQRVNKQESRISLGAAVSLAEEFMTTLRPLDYIDHLTPAGSLRRWAPTIGDIDLMATSLEPERAMDAFIHQPQVAHILGTGPTKSSIVADNGLQVDFRIVEPRFYGSLLQHFTGNRDHNIQLREYALHRGLSLNEYGITTVSAGESRTFTSEEKFYEVLGLEWIPPELRQGTGEIEAAQAHALPHLVTVDQIRGDLHAHTEWSDGSVSIEDMALAARDLGYEFLAITDHSGGIGVAGGLNPDRLQEQIARIREVDREIEGITLLTGSEVEIKSSGTLDFPDEILAELDWVIASVHSGFNQSEQQITNRIIRAMENPHVDAIGHPTGGLIGKRAPYAIDLEAVFKAAARTGTALEINSFPQRLDLVDVHVRRAIDLGAMIVINTDAHAPVHFGNIRYGVEMARRGWAEAGNVLNTRPLPGLRDWLRRASPSP